MLATVAVDGLDLTQELQNVGISAEQSRVFLRIFGQLVRDALRREEAERLSLLPGDLQHTLSSLRDAVGKNAGQQDVQEMRKDYDLRMAEINHGIKELDVKLETAKRELTRDIKELDVKLEVANREIEAKLETAKRELTRDIKELDVKLEVAGRGLDVKLEMSMRELEAKLETTKKELETRIEMTKAELKRDIEVAKIEVQRDMANTRTSLIQWTAGFFAVQTGVVVGSIYALLRLMLPH
ncbi:MAG: hypothetical protein HQL58_00315 [Magnetococcales bacterium]|nr:hypothetical protein [Magnetococcales bacterium]